MDSRGFSVVAFIVALLASGSAIFLLFSPGNNEEAAKLGIVAGFSFVASLIYGVIAWLHARKRRRV